MYADVVIGANFGDEGKGLIVDKLAHNSGIGRDSIVVRFNGGAQAAHTVVTPEHRHVFQHFGSGTLTGAITFLSKFFVVNPTMFVVEKTELDKICPAAVCVDPEARLTTPFDMLVNQVVERHRGSNRHGSCGLGIHETVNRIEQWNIDTRVKDIQDLDTLRDKLVEIRDGFVPHRLVELGIKTIAGKYQHFLQDDNVIDLFLDECELMAQNVMFCGPEILSRADYVIFEGAQGLLLAQDHRFFPHVTHDHTGLTNAILVAKAAGIKRLRAVYVTRWYMTRHGAGPFPTEDPNISFHDATNAPNDWQGTLRFGSLDLSLMCESIKNDIEKANGFDIDPVLAVTCLDQANNSQSELEHITYNSPIPLRFLSYGETRSSVKII